MRSAGALEMCPAGGTVGGPALALARSGRTLPVTASTLRLARLTTRAAGTLASRCLTVRRPTLRVGPFSTLTIRTLTISTLTISTLTISTLTIRRVRGATVTIGATVATAARSVSTGGPGLRRRRTVRLGA